MTAVVVGGIDTVVDVDSLKAPWEKFAKRSALGDNFSLKLGFASPDCATNQMPQIHRAAKQLVSADLNHPTPHSPVQLPHN